MTLSRLPPKRGQIKVKIVSRLVKLVVRIVSKARERAASKARETAEPPYKGGDTRCSGAYAAGERSN
ncbi:hypothetical protein ACFX13_009652 [Malus domestica]